MGVITYITLCAFHPFDPDGTASAEEMQAAIAACRYDFSDAAWSAVSGEAKDLIARMLARDPAARLSAAQVLEHPWLRAEASAAAVAHTAHAARPLAAGALHEESSCVSDDGAAAAAAGGKCALLSPEIGLALARYKKTMAAKMIKVSMLATLAATSMLRSGQRRWSLGGGAPGTAAGTAAAAATGDGDGDGAAADDPFSIDFGMATTAATEIQAIFRGQLARTEAARAAAAAARSVGTAA